MLLLAFDTATPAITAALHDGSAPLASRTVVDQRRHAELLVPSIDAVLREAGASRRDLTDVAVGVGPGPFTGLRVGLVTARSLGHALGVAVHGLCTLDVLAWEYFGAGPFLAVTDARRREVYWASYRDRGTRLAGPAVALPHSVEDRGLPAVGYGAALYPDAFPDARPPQYPSAEALAGLAVARLRDGVPTGPPEPLYLRRPDARLPGPRKHVTPA
ncbi:MAG: tRNA (adenosine(37)-N6)-threonylcarbamoyltransferase complex dimerization subunit type 1 TsaB [Streptosporangiales bacterium]|nr:tRNA (adenosine(37)-N6)-threonylcarbamoyltransferase complex dimerization subunit type 1 TsaB [Streptosporangiales bacterium]